MFEGAAAPLVAYFLIPLPEPIALPEGVPFQTTELEDYEESLRLTGSDGHPDSMREDLAVTNLISVIAHHREAVPQDYVDIAALLDLAHEVLPWATGWRARTRHYARQRLDRVQGVFGRWSRRRRVPPIKRQLTVVELAIVIDHELDDVIEALSDAFDEGLEFVRKLQLAYHTLRHDPISLCTRESLPPAVPYAIGRARYGQLPMIEHGLSIYLVNQNLWQMVRAPDLSSEEVYGLSSALRAIQKKHAFLTYLDVAREAELALLRRGDYRATAILAATAAEALFDDLLMHLLWEEAIPPDEAARSFVDPRRGVKSRVVSEYASRLGGTWQTDRPGVLHDWLTDVAEVRHRCVHGAYVPTYDEASKSIVALRALEQFVAGRITQPGILSRFPRTAMALVGVPGLQRRGLWRGKMRKLATDPTEPDWAQAYSRWRDLVEDARLRARW